MMPCILLTSITSGTNRRRTLIAAGVQCFQQFQGAQFILNYIYIFLAEIGIKNTYQVGIYLYLVNLISAGCAFYMADKFGRRPLLAIGALVMCISMCVVGGLAGVAGAKTSGQQNGALAALFIWLAVQAVAWGSWYVSSLSFPYPGIVENGAGKC
jgi:SP family sugar:H+ symporter-like MFS transporter